MDDKLKNPDEPLRRVAEAYWLTLDERPRFVHHVTQWDGERAAGLLRSRERLLAEFDESGDSSVEDLLDLEMARFYVEYNSGKLDDSVSSLARAAAVIVRAMVQVMAEKAAMESAEAGG